MKESSSLRWIAFVRPAVGLLLFYKEKSEENKNMKNYKIAVAGTGSRDIIGSTKKNHDN